MTTPVIRRRKKPIEVDTIQWTGTNEADVQAFTGGPSVFYALDAEDREGSDDPEATATVFDKLHSTWILVYTGQHIVRGVKGEHHPIAEDVLAETYEAVSSAVAQSAPADRAADVASCPGRELDPNPCHCPCYGCKHHCSAHNPEEVPDSESAPAEAALRDRIRRAVCEAEGFAWDSDMLEPDEYGDHADAVLAALFGPIPAGTDVAAWTAIRAIQLMNEAGQRRDDAKAALLRELIDEAVECDGYITVQELRRMARKTAPTASAEPPAAAPAVSSVGQAAHTTRSAALERVVQRIGQMADAWEQQLPEVIRTPAVVSAIRDALEPVAELPAPTDVAACSCEAEVHVGAGFYHQPQCATKLRRMAAETQPAEAHSCPNCEGVDPDTCWMNPDRPPEQCPAAEFEDYGQQCTKPSGHNLHSFEEQQPDVTPPAGGAQQPKEAEGPRTVCVCGHTRAEHVTVGGPFGRGRLLCTVCNGLDGNACKEFEAL